MHPGLVIQADVDEVGPQSWMSGLLIPLAQNRPDAVEYFVASMDALTGGNFSKFYDPTQPIALETARIYKGHFSDGTKKSLAHFDYLAVANLTGDRNPETIAEFSETMVNETNDVKVHLSRRRQIIQHLCPSAVFEGWQRRITFNPVQMGAIAQAFAASKFHAPLVQNFGDIQGTQRSTSSFARNMMMSSTPSGVFSNNFGRGGASRTFGVYNGRHYSR